MALVSDGAYARAGVDQSGAGRAVSALVQVLSGIDSGRPSRSVLPSGHYASVLRLDDERGLALSSDGVGTKIVVAEQLGRLETVGIDCVAMNVNDVICVGAEPIAVLDYIAVEEAEAEMLSALATGLRRGAELAGVEIPGGELAVVPELIRGQAGGSGGFDLVGFCAGLVDLDSMVTGERIEPEDALLGIPSSGIHSNGLTLARRALPDLEERPDELGGRSVGEELLEPTAIYVRAVRELLESGLDVRGLAHITGEGFLNLLRLAAPVGYRIEAPLPVPPIFELVAARARVDDAELWEVFNMGCGFCCLVAPGDAASALELLGRHHPGTVRIGTATAEAGLVELPRQRLTGRRPGGFSGFSG